MFMEKIVFARSYNAQLTIGSVNSRVLSAGRAGSDCVVVKNYLPPEVGAEDAATGRAGQGGQCPSHRLPSLELEEDAVPDGPRTVFPSPKQEACGRGSGCLRAGPHERTADRCGKSSPSQRDEARPRSTSRPCHRYHEVRVKRSGWSAVLVWISSSSPLNV